MSLPKVSKGVIASVRESMKQKGYIENKWENMIIDNEDMFRCISSSTKVFKHRTEKESFLRGAFLVWNLLNSQIEADEMNEEWG